VLSLLLFFDIEIVKMYSDIYIIINNLLCEKGHFCIKRVTLFFTILCSKGVFTTIRSCDEISECSTLS
jgi:hypothetical protein